MSVDGRSLELASSHSSDEEDSSRNKKVASPKNPNYLPNIPPYRNGASASRLHTVQPPPHLNVIANSELFKPIYAPRWPSQTYTAGMYKQFLNYDVVLTSLIKRSIIYYLNHTLIVYTT